MVRPTINSEKHIFQIPFNNAAIGSPSREVLITAVASPSANNEVRVGATVKAVYVELWFQGEGMGTGTSIAVIEKLPIGDNGPTTTDLITLNAYNNKKNVFWTQQGLSGDQNTNPVPVLRGWMKIPKGKQRFGLGDSFTLSMVGQVDGFNYCGVAIYKEYF